MKKRAAWMRFREGAHGSFKPELAREVRRIEEEEPPSCLKTRRAKPGDPLWEELSGTVEKE